MVYEHTYFSIFIMILVLLMLMAEYVLCLFEQ